MASESQSVRRTLNTQSVAKFSSVFQAIYQVREEKTSVSPPSQNVETPEPGKATPTATYILRGLTKTKWTVCVPV